jgi:hypothetical protein
MENHSNRNIKNRMKLLMNYQSDKTLTENYNTLLVKSNNNDFVISDMMSPDNRYFILMDEMYDLKENRKIGNFWDNIDNITLFLTHSFKHATNIPQQIREENLINLGKLSLNESLNSDLFFIKESAKELFNQIILNEKTWGEWAWDGAKDLGNWLGKSATDLVTGTTKMIGDAGKGLYQIGGAILSGDVTKILSLLGQGFIYFARWLRNALYNPIGATIDAVLIATGIGKEVQWIPWAIVVALDIYEFMSGDSEHKDDPLWWQLLTIGFDVIGLVTAGFAAKAAKTQLSGLKQIARKSPEEIALFLEKNPGMRKTIEGMLTNVNKVSGFLEKAVNFLMKPFPKAAEWIKGILGKVSGFISKFTQGLGELFSTKGAKLVGKELAINYGVEKAVGAGAELFAGSRGAESAIAQGSTKAAKSTEDLISSIQKSGVDVNYEGSGLF